MMKTAGSITVNGTQHAVTNAYSCGPGEAPHAYEFVGGRVERFGNEWTLDRRYGAPVKGVQVDVSGYTGVFK